ncbi:MAG: Holliday junction resolvase RuvX [Trueperaceae bacterium]|jgi:putative Holliday junction resolvase|nr:Holliday junction resolvase RuvX [Trueperaceae bacterium]|tara:strand:+ start:134 stop:562 length:429 start_codon:yes stop_codon:yes gene_type:complete
MSIMRGILALDVGEARIGVAVSPPGTSFVFGRETILRSNLSTDLQKIYDLADIEKATLIVVGLPVRTDGKESLQAKRICSFTEAIKQHGLEVTFEDERYTSKLASRHIARHNPNKSIKRNKGLIDKISAVLILESFIERTKL